MSTPTTYKEAGVDINAGNELVERIRPAVSDTRRAGVLGTIGGFGGLFELPWEKYRQPVLVSGTDGVGTKLRLAIDNNRHDGIGIDLVAMCVNDIVVTGAEPLFFLDYFATARLDIDVAAQVITSIAAGCQQAGAALVGGETAEMPGLYAGDDYDLAGFAVGIVEKDEVIDGSNIVPGDCIVGIASSGPHANGFSLIRQLLPAASQRGVAIDPEALLAPTRIYVKPALAACRACPVKGMAHVTGGGLTENLPRALPAGTCAEVDCSSWQRPEIFQQLQQCADISTAEMYRVFNCGIGFAVVVAANDVADVMQCFVEYGMPCWQIGRVTEADGSSQAASLHYLNDQHF